MSQAVQEARIWAARHLVGHWCLTGLRCGHGCLRRHLCIEGDNQSEGSLYGFVRVDNALHI